MLESTFDLLENLSGIMNTKRQLVHASQNTTVKSTAQRIRRELNSLERGDYKNIFESQNISHSIFNLNG